MLESQYKGPIIQNQESLAKELKLPVDVLLSFADKADEFYFPERREFKGNGKFRVINEPFDSLKGIQLKILKSLLRKVTFAEYLSGGVKDRNHVMSVRSHGKVKSIITEDIKDFFPSVSSNIVMQIWLEFFRFPNEVAAILTKLTTYRDYLPQGARTSTYLSNLVFFNTEPKLVEALNRQGFKYSRHVDDMNISSTRSINEKTRKFLQQSLETMLQTRDCRLNESKHKIQDRSQPCRVHGLLINAGRPTKGKRNLSNLRVAIKQLEQYFYNEAATQKELEFMFRKTQGRVAEILQYQPNKVYNLRERLNAVKRAASNKWPSFLIF